MTPPNPRRAPAPVRRALALGVLAALALAAGCTPERHYGPTPTYYDSWSPEQEAQAVAGAEQAIRDWMHVKAQCLVDPPNTDPSCFDQVDVDTARTNDRAMLQYAQDNGVRYVGEATYVQTEKVVKVDLSIGPDKEVQLVGCQSLSDFDIIQVDGTSALPSDWPRRQRSIFVVRKHADKWQLADIQEDPEGSEC